MAQLLAVTHSDDLLTVNWSDGKTSQLDAFWLRDHCQMPVSRNPDNSQRLLNVLDIPEDLSISGIRQLGESGVEVTFLPENHTSIFTSSWLRENCYCLNSAFDDRSASNKTLWQNDFFPKGFPTQAYTEFTGSKQHKLVALQNFSDYGFVILTDVPCVAGQVLKVINQFGFNRKTNYGEIFDVRTEINPNNLAFSNLGLGCHTDNPYRYPVPTIQLLHCLSNSASGGDSILVDGFNAAEILRQESPQNFAVLVENWVNFRFSDVDTELNSRVPLIETNNFGEVTSVRYNNRSIASLRLPAQRIKAFYTAYRHFAGIIERDSLKLEFKLEPGHLVLFDNTRVMHARTAFSAQGKRHLQGAYADLDGLYSTLNVLKRGA